jgi:hypothetical protein
MALKFSETQFSFCYVFEILKKYPKLMPIFPTLREEKYLGYDVKIGGSLFLQFKRPKYLANNKYQIKLARDQFQILYNLKLNKPANKVFYVAPIFHTLQDMRNFYVTGKIEENSAHFPLENFPASFSAKSHLLNYEHDASVSAQPNSIPLTINGSMPKGTYGVLNSEPVSVNTEHRVITEQDARDPMKLSEKTDFLLKEVIPENVSNKYEYDNEVDKLYSILLVEYNILWIPIL